MPGRRGLVSGHVIPVYSGDSKRPDKFMVEWKQDGRRQDRVIVRNT
ncbi:hypothetical protein SAMN06296429_11116 [Janibacter indicus]|uniref:Uncharacterized protein n=1 Tax=Janibacter indicus TaxID=857417 RepID=A0A1W2CE81_9MICO|nr:hypothetical protein SAMN06296429_11116 [Janibacter indicus]